MKVNECEVAECVLWRAGAVIVAITRWSAAISLLGCETQPLPRSFENDSAVQQVPTWAPITVSQTSVSTSTQPSQRKVQRVVLDPGHGGTDDGAVGPSGLREKDVVLDIAHRAAPILAHELQMSTLLTRDMDVAVSLETRAVRANAFGADLFISIHCNASKNPLARGIEVFTFDVRDKDLQFASDESEVHQEGSSTEWIDTSMGHEQPLHQMHRKSEHFADLLRASMESSFAVRYADSEDLGSKEARFFVLSRVAMQSVLLETAFVSNASDEHRLMSADYRQKIADAIVNAVRAYRSGL